MAQRKLQEILMDYRRCDLLHFASRKELKGVSRCLKKELAEKLAVHMLKPEVMERFFCWMTDDDLDHMEEEPPIYLCMYDYAERVDEERFVILDEVLEAYKKIDTKEFHEKRRIYSKVLKCLEYLEEICEIIPIELLMQKILAEADEEITEMQVRQILADLSKIRWIDQVDLS